MNQSASVLSQSSGQQIVAFKLVMIGDKSVGKTSIVKRYTENTFSIGTESTIGAQFTSKIIEISPQGVVPVKVKLQIWDTAGEEKFRSITPMYYKNAAAVALIYDICSEESFSSVERWVQEIEQNGANQLQLALVANKCDMAEQQEVPFKTGMEYAKKLQAIFQQTSAKSNEGIDDLFRVIAEKLYLRHLAGEQEVVLKKRNDTVKITKQSLIETQGKNSGGCSC